MIPGIQVASLKNKLQAKQDAKETPSTFEKMISLRPGSAAQKAESKLKDMKGSLGVERVSVPERMFSRQETFLEQPEKDVEASTPVHRPKPILVSKPRPQQTRVNHAKVSSNTSLSTASICPAVVSSHVLTIVSSAE